MFDVQWRKSKNIIGVANIATRTPPASFSHIKPNCDDELLYEL